MDYNKWYAVKNQTIQNNIESDISNKFGENCALTGGRPSSWTYSSALNIGISTLRSEILLLLDESFDFLPKTEGNIEIIKNEILNTRNLGINYIKSKKDGWISLYNSNFAANINPSNSKIAEIDSDISRKVEKYKQIVKDKKKQNRKDIIWKIVTISISIIALMISLFKR